MLSITSRFSRWKSMGRMESADRTAVPRKVILGMPDRVSALCTGSADS